MIVGMVSYIAGQSLNIYNLYKAINDRDTINIVLSIADIITGIVVAGFSKCFDGDTPVLTEDGSKRIDEIEVGDRVWSYNFETGEVELCEVTEVFVNETYEILSITVDGEVIDATAGHPFYVDGRGWVEAGELNTGSLLLDNNGITKKVTAISNLRLEYPILVYNFAVENNHNYFVGYVLVHNVCTDTDYYHFSNKDNTKLGRITDFKAFNATSLDDVVGYSVIKESGMSVVRDPYKTTFTGHFFKILANTELPEGFDIYSDSDNHSFFYPIVSMTIKAYNKSIGSLDWKWGGYKK
ncbi:MAG: HINT domain-containing protein [Clostridiales bacterium]|nr:HINT domain-containing protein [Clostridiales bacterium]